MSLRARRPEPGPRSTNMAPTSARDGPRKRPKGLEGDVGNLATLLVLYTLQGAPMGIAAALPLLLAYNENVGYKQQALLSLITWPYSFKLLWAPVVDSVYVEKWGRRKSWVVPVQLCVGGMLVGLSTFVTAIMESEAPDVRLLTGLFLVLYFMVATQDIAVDGWALTMLSRRNVGYASMCNVVGQTTGYIVCYALFMSLHSVKFCNSYVRPVMGWPQVDGPMVTIGGFMRFWGVVFIVVTLLIAVLRPERAERQRRTTKDRDPELALLATPASQRSDASGVEAPSVSLKDAYLHMWQVICRPNVKGLVVCLVTAFVAFSATDAATRLELVELGVPSEHLALMAVAYAPLEVIFSFMLSRVTAGPRPMSAWLTAYPVRLFFALTLAAVTAWAPHPDPVTGQLPVWFYAVAMTNFVFYRLACNVMFVCIMSFFNRVADPAIGGTYMTLLNTCANLGMSWPNPTILLTIDWITTKVCYASQSSSVELAYSCIAPVSQAPATNTTISHVASACKAAGGVCRDKVDGYETMVVVCVLLGLVWLKLMRPRVKALERAKLETWRVATTTTPRL